MVVSGEWKNSTEFWEGFGRGVWLITTLFSNSGSMRDTGSCLASPKSNIFTSCSPLCSLKRYTLLGFKSRCTTPFGTCQRE
jgi:hypothetical protein